jgi:hypothetical protein
MRIEMHKIFRSTCLFLALFACLTLASHPVHHQECAGVSVCHLCQTSLIPAEISIHTAAPDLHIEEAPAKAAAVGHKIESFSEDLTRGPPIA